MPPSYFVYVLQCGDGSLYTGYTSNLQRRLRLHMDGRGAKYTRSRLPVSLAACWQGDNKSAAMSLERAIKGLERPAKLRLIAGENASLLQGPLGRVESGAAAYVISPMASGDRAK